MFESVHDSRAANLPHGQNYLIMQNLYKTCFLYGEKIVLDLAISAITNDKTTKTVDKKFLELKMQEFEKMIMVRASGGTLFTEIR